MRRRRSRWLRVGDRLTFGRLRFGRTRRPRRSRRLQLYEAQIGMRPAVTSAGPSALAGAVERYLTPITLLITLACALYVAVGTSWFYIYDIEVEGAELLTKEELYQRSNLEALSFFWLRPATVARRLEEDPLVAQAVVSAMVPNRVRVEIQERTPLVVWQSSGGSHYVDGEGILFALRGDARSMLVIRDLRGETVAAGDRVDPEVVRAAMELSTLLPERRAYDWDPGLGISFVDENEWRVAFGDHTRLPVKVAAYLAFMEQIRPEKEIVLLDLSVPEHPYYRVGD